MNILVYVPQMAAFGGMERHVCDLAAALAGRGHRVVLITTSNSLGAALRSGLAAQGVALRELGRRRGRASRTLKCAWLAREVMRARGTRWDLIYTNGQSALARWVWLAAGPRTRIVHHHHTAADAAEQTTWSPAFHRALLRAPELVGCSRATQRSLAAALRRDDVAFLPYLTASPVRADEVADRPVTAGATLHFGFIGRLVAEKGIDRICALSALPELGDIAWHIHGAGAGFPPDHFAAFPNVTCHGAYTTPAQHAAALRALDALVLFSRHNEGMPLSLIEGMSAGLPWIATDRGGTREIAVSPANALVVEAAPGLESLAAAVREMALRIRTGITSRREQRRAYDATFAPVAVAGAWCGYFERPAAPTRSLETAATEPRAASAAR